MNSSQNDKDSNRKELRNLLEFAIAIEAAGDVVSKTLSQLAAKRDRDGIRFSEEGLAELRGMHDRVVANIALAGNVLSREMSDRAPADRRKRVGSRTVSVRARKAI